MDTFCVLPWYSNELPINTPCCLLPQNTNIDQLKSDLLAGVRSAACAKCWRIEDSEQQSRRQLENIFLDYKLDRNLDQIRQDCCDNKSSILLYQIKTSNLCNQACVSCNSSASSKWAEIETKMGITPIKYTSSTAEKFDINYATAQRLELLGGEPFFDSTTFDILEKLVEHNNTDCFISIVTNGSVSLSSAQLAMLARFTNLNICVSVDGIGPVFEYMRWPAKWPSLVENIKQYQTIAKIVSVSYTISSLNALYYDETVAWFKSNNLNYNHNIITHPDWLNLSRAPDAFKKEFNKNKFLSGLLDFKDPIDIAVYIDNIASQDTAKKIDIRNYLPQVAGIIFDNLRN